MVPYCHHHRLELYAAWDPVVHVEAACPLEIHLCLLRTVAYPVRFPLASKALPQLEGNWALRSKLDRYTKGIESLFSEAMRENPGVLDSAC